MNYINQCSFLLTFNRKLIQGMWMLLLVLLAFCLVPARSAYAATFVVNSTADADDAAPGDGNCDDGSGNCTLRAAISEANALVGADDIVFDSSLDGTPITLSIAGTGEDGNATGDLDIVDDVTITGNGVDNTIIEAGTTISNGIDRVFHVTSGTTITIEDVAIRHGRINANGGGIYNQGTLTVNNSTVSGNTATGSWGGGIFNDSSRTLIINNSTFNDNTASLSGGIGSFGAMTIDSSTLTGNSGLFGGGYRISNCTGATTINNTTISGNTASNTGGGVYSYNCTQTIRNSTITNNTSIANSATSSGGVASNTGATTIENTIVYGNDSPNRPDDTVDDCAFTVVSAGGNVVGSGTGCPSGGADDSTSPPNLGVLTDNGGSTQTHALMAGSSAIDRTASGTRGCGTTLITDQRGVLRPQGANCDSGAFEGVALVAGGSSGGLGPGGVGHTDGSTALGMWVRADKDVYTDAGCTTPATNGNDVGCWQDQSGNGHDYTQGALVNQPNYLTGVRNNQPVIQFFGDGNPDFLDSTAVLTAGDDTFTYFANWMATQTNIDHVIFEQNNSSPVTGRRAALIGTPFALYGFNGLNNDFHYAAPYAPNQYELSSVILNGNASNNVLVYDSGRQYVGTINMTTQNIGDASSTIGRYTFAPGFDMRGNITEIIVFSDDLNDTNRILVENYLSSKYDVALDTANGAIDVYDGDTGGNGDFDLDVAGIGQFGGNQHTQAHAAGMIVADSNFLNDDGDWLLFGHRTTDNDNVVTELPTTGDWATAPDPYRWARHFYIDVTDNTTGTNCSTPGTCFVDIIFDYSEGSMDLCCSPSGDVNNYRLLKRTDDTNPAAQFSDIATATAIVGDQVHFQNVDVTDLGSNFTIGTLNYSNSPTAVSLTSLTSQTQTPLVAVLLAAFILFGTMGWWFVRRRQA